MSVRKHKSGRPPKSKKRRFDPADEDDPRLPETFLNNSGSHDNDNAVPSSNPTLGAACQGEGDQAMVSQPLPPRQENSGQEEDEEEVIRPHLTPSPPPGKGA